MHTIVKIETNIPLSHLTTMRIGGIAHCVIHVTSNKELRDVYEHYKKDGAPIYVIGGGSNLIAHDEGFAGVIVKNEIMGIEVLENTPKTTTIKANSGESWDELVKFSVDKQLSGIEAMSGIPGSVGAAPVQNIGAYGQELGDTFVSLEAYDTQSKNFVTLSREDCEFSYRHSIFRGKASGRYIITAVTFMLSKNKPQPPFYDSLQKYLESNNIDMTNLTVQSIRDAVLHIRSVKLPDPAKLPNSGSFFKNVIIENWKANEIREKHSDFPSFVVDNGHVKIPAGWLIERAGLKGQLLHGIKVHKENAVVLINESASSYADLDAARTDIIEEVKSVFDIQLEQEPLEIPS